MKLNTFDDTKGNLNPVENMMLAIKEKGGEFHFDVTFSQEGWMARCREFPQILVWGDGSPSNDEVTEATSDAVKSAFGITSEMDSAFKLNKRHDHENSYAPVRLTLKSHTYLFA